MTVSTYNTADFGCNPFVLDGPNVLGSGVIVPQFKLGHVSWGDSEAEMVYCKLVLAGATTLFPGQLYAIDDDFTATLLSTSNSPRGVKVMALLVNAPASSQQAAGTYYGWFMRAGQIPVAYTTLTANSLTETTATAGSANSPAAPTVSSKLITGLYYTKAPATFTADVTNGDKVLRNLVGVSVGSGPFIGAVLSGTGIAASQRIEFITYSAQGIPLTIVMSAVATVTTAAVTITPSLVGEARLMWPYVDKTN